MKDILLLIDANSLIHRAFHALPPFTSPDKKPTGALYGLSSILIKVLREGPLKKGTPVYIAAAFDRPEPTFRKVAYKDYKATRPPAKSELIEQLKESRHLFEIFGIKTFELAGFEADDIIATLAEKFSKEGDLTIVGLSGDHDLLQIVKKEEILIETPKKGISDTIIYNEKEVYERFGVFPNQITDYKGLVGDTSDNIPGVPGVGPKKTAEVLSKYSSLEKLYEELDELGISDIKLQDKLLQYRDQAFLSKELATLKNDVPLVVELEDLRYTGLQKEKIEAYFNKLGFPSLVQRIE